MPSRAFLFFPHIVYVGEQALDLIGSQCPRGHFCFFHSGDLFDDEFLVPDAVSMPSRAFLFFPRRADVGFGRLRHVSMPSRAFLFFPLMRGVQSLPH